MKEEKKEAMTEGTNEMNIGGKAEGLRRREERKKGGRN